MGQFLVVGTDCRVAGAPTFIPGLTPEKNHSLVTLMVNRTLRGGKKIVDEITANFWGKAASIAANYLGVGKGCNVTGRLQSYSQATGRIRANGGAEILRRIEIVVTSCDLLADSRKVQEAEMATNITALKAQGRIPGAVNLTLDDLFMKKSTMTDFNPAASQQTGKYGHSKVWSKDLGFWGGGVGLVAPNSQAIVPAGDTAAQIANLQQTILNLRAASANAPVVSEVVNDEIPVPTAEVAAASINEVDVFAGQQ